MTVSKFHLYYFLAAPSRIYGGQNYVFATLPLQLLVVGGGGTSVAPAPLFAVPVSIRSVPIRSLHYKNDLRVC